MTLSRIRFVPRTLSGKKCEVPIKRILLGSETQQVLTHSTVPVLVLR